MGVVAAVADTFVAAVTDTFVATVAAVVEAEGREEEWREVEGRAVEGREVGIEPVEREERATTATVDFGTTTGIPLPLLLPVPVPLSVLETDALILLPLRTLFPLLFDGKAKVAACTPPAF